MLRSAGILFFAGFYMEEEMEKSRMTTLCYIERDGAYLMLHRVSKKHDVNKDKWIGIGGHFEEGESPEECLLREAKEETGLTLTSYRFRGLVTFMAEGWPTEYMCLYTADKYEGEMADCNEGVLEWVKKEEVLKLNLWEGDKIFFRLLNEDVPFFSLKLSYNGDRLKEAVLDGRRLELFDIRDEAGNVTGQVRERTLVHRDGDLHGTAHIWIARRREAGALTCSFRNAAGIRTPIRAAMTSPLQAMSRPETAFWRRLSVS